MPLTLYDPLTDRCDQPLWAAVADRHAEISGWSGKASLFRGKAGAIKLGEFTLKDVLRGGRDLELLAMLRSVVRKTGATIWGTPIEQFPDRLSADNVFPVLVLGRPLADSHLQAFTSSSAAMARSSGALERVARFVRELDTADYLNPMDAVVGAAGILQSRYQGRPYSEQVSIWCGAAPCLVAGLTRRYEGLQPIEPRDDLPPGVVGQYLGYLGLPMGAPAARVQQIVNAYLWELSTHGTNLSTTGALNFTSGGGSALGGVTVGAQYLAVPKHGGAQGLIGPMIDDLRKAINWQTGQPLPGYETIFQWAVARFKAGKLIDGCGHPVIAGNHDPRGVYFRSLLEADFPADPELQLAWSFMDHIPNVGTDTRLKELTGKEPSSLYTNVDFPGYFLQKKYLGITNPGSFVLLFLLARASCYIAQWFETKALALAISRLSNLDGARLNELLVES